MQRNLTPPETADFLGELISRPHTNTLANWRHAGKGPDHLKIGGRIYYSPEAIATWLAGEHGLSVTADDVSSWLESRTSAA